jgi:hypothetical protein
MTPHHIEARFIDFTINIAAPLILFGAINKPHGPKNITSLVSL